MVTKNLRTAVGAGLGIGLTGSLGGGILGGLGGKMFGKKKKADPYAQMAAASQQSYNKYLNNASNLLSKDYDIATDANQGNEDLLEGYQNYLNNKYNDNKFTFYQNNENNLYDSYIKDLTDKNRADLQRNFNNQFANYGTTNSYLDNYWTNTSDNSFVNDYLSNYYNNALSKLDTAKSRGLLNETGYNNALNELNTRNSAANSGVNSLTDSVLSGYRDDLSSLASNIQTGIDNYSLAQRDTDLKGQWNNQLSDLYGQQQQNFTGDMNNALSGYTPYDVSDILANARNTQGVVNANTDNNELLASLKDQDKSKQNKVGLGNQGIF